MKLIETYGIIMLFFSKYQNVWACGPGQATIEICPKGSEIIATDYAESHIL